jgi:hypothetical protein
MCDGRFLNIGQLVCALTVADEEALVESSAETAKLIPARLHINKVSAKARTVFPQATVSSIRRNGPPVAGFIAKAEIAFVSGLSRTRVYLSAKHHIAKQL